MLIIGITLGQQGLGEFDYLAPGTPGQNSVGDSLVDFTGLQLADGAQVEQEGQVDAVVIISA